MRKKFKYVEEDAGNKYPGNQIQFILECCKCGHKVELYSFMFLLEEKRKEKPIGTNGNNQTCIRCKKCDNYIIEWNN